MHNFAVDAQWYGWFAVAQPSHLCLTLVERNMPSRIPVRIAEHNFRSINQARGYYCDILHQYQPGQKIDEQHQEVVMELMGSAGDLPDAGDGTQWLQVMRGKFGRNCFAAVTEGKGVQVMSIVRAVKGCVKTEAFQPETQRVSP